MLKDTFWYPQAAIDISHHWIHCTPWLHSNYSVLHSTTPKSQQPAQITMAKCLYAGKCEKHGIGRLLDHREHLDVVAQLHQVAFELLSKMLKQSIDQAPPFDTYDARLGVNHDAYFSATPNTNVEDLIYVIWLTEASATCSAEEYYLAINQSIKSMKLALPSDALCMNQ